MGGLWQTSPMDFFQKLFGYKEPTLIVAESETWTELPVSDELDAAMVKRARKEGWTGTADEEHAFHCLVRVEGPFSSAPLEVESLGIRIAVLDHGSAAGIIERMRADNGLRVTAVKAIARLDAAGRWGVRVNI